jgi:hypothetical protein
MPIAAEGWIALVVFILLVVGSSVLCWLAFKSGNASMGVAAFVNMAAVAALVAGFVWLVRAKMTRLPPRST